MSVGARLRTHWIVSTLVVSVGFLSFGPVVPAAALNGAADNPAEYSACVGDAAKPAGFEDTVGRSFAEAAADCLAHYGITEGTSAGKFSPSVAVPRWQMALFLARAAGPAGIVVPRASDQGFTDLDEMGPHTRDAINQLAALGIMKGTSASTLSPDAGVTRQQMALLLSRFLAAAPTGPGGSDIDDIEPDDDVFRDIDQVPRFVHEAIRSLYELGVTDGTSATTFSPDALVSRVQMAVFITRMLAHTNARPAGLSVQASATHVFRNSDVRLSISVRDAHHQPIADAYLDVFAVADPAKAFTRTGACTDHVLAAAGGRACTIDSTDEDTDRQGNWSVDVEVEDDVDGLRIWTWTGAIGASFDEETTESVTIDIMTLNEATAIRVSDDLPPTAKKAQLGESVTFTFQTVDRFGQPVPQSGVGFTVEAEESQDNGQRRERTTIQKQTSSDGQARVTFKNTDPSDQPGDYARLTLRIGGGLMVKDETTVEMVGRNSSLEWTDESAVTTTLELTLSRAYQVASDTGDGAANTVRATLTDQYGGPVARERIVFISNDNAGVPYGVRRTTNTGGVATLNYLRDAAGGGTERITARFGKMSDSINHYWVAPVSGSAGGSGKVLAVDTTENTVVVVSATDSVIIEYDANDQYNVDGTAVHYSGFEEALTVGDTLAYTINGTAESVVNTFTLRTA